MLDARSFFLGLLFALAIGVLAFGAISTFYPQNGIKSPNVLTANSILSPSSALVYPSSGTSVEPLFSPGSSDEIISLIRSAKNTIDVEMYVFTDTAGLGKELADAQARGVTVRLILEPRVTASNLDELAAAMSGAGVQVRWASLHFALTHAKMMIVDGHKVLVGSINFSKAAQGKNREAAVILDGPVAADYERVFETDWADGSMVRRTSAAATEAG